MLIPASGIGQIRAAVALKERRECEYALVIRSLTTAGGERCQSNGDPLTWSSS